MFEKTQYANSIILGCSVNEQPFFLSEIRAEEEFKIQGVTYSGYILTLQDRTGNINGFLPADKVKKEYSSCINRVIAVNGIALKNDESIYVKVDSIALIEEGNYEAKHFMIGLDASKRRSFINLIKNEINEVKNPNYKALLNAAFTDENLMKMAERPASLKSFANYHGGLLVVTAELWHIVRNIAGSYAICKNGIYSSVIDTDLLYTASLLHGIGKLREWTDFPFKKSKEGKLQGTVGTLQRTISDLCKKPEVNLSEDEEMELVSTIIPAIDSRNQVKAVSKEAVILQQALLMLKTCDEYDKAVYEYQGDEDIFYSWQLRAYVKNEQKVG